MSSDCIGVNIDKHYVFALTKGQFPTGIKDQFTAIEIEKNGDFKRIYFQAETGLELNQLDDVDDALGYVSPRDDIEVLNPDIIIVVGQAHKRYVERIWSLLKECPRVSLVYFEKVLPYLLLSKQIDVTGTIEVSFHNDCYRVTLQEDNSLLVEAVAEVGENAIKMSDADFVILQHLPNLGSAAKKAEFERKFEGAQEQMESEAEAKRHTENAESELVALKIAYEELQEKFALAEKSLARYQYLPDDYEREMAFGTWTYKTITSERCDIPWYVLYRENNPEKGINRALIISQYALLQMRFDGESNDWASSEVRQWLNNEFLQQAFSAEERERIIPAIDGVPVEEGAVKASQAVEDSVFLLSLDEMKKYFKSNEERMCWLWPLDGAELTETCWWWLRSGDGCYAVHGIHNDGNYDGGESSHEEGTVRPALWVKL